MPSLAWQQKLRGGLIQLFPLLRPSYAPFLAQVFPSPVSQTEPPSAWACFHPSQNSPRANTSSWQGVMEPGNFPQKKGNFGARWDELQNLRGFGSGRGGTDSTERFLSSVSKKQS